MDYPFLIGKLGSVPLECLERVRSFALDEAGYREHNYFKNDPGQRLSNKSMGWSSVDAIDPDVLAVLRQYKLDTLTLGAATLNRVHAHSSIREHSDLNSAGNLAWRKIHRHIIHVPVLNDRAVYLHRRAKSEANSTFKMELGGVYLYNNYVWHTVDNPTDQPRVNLLIEMEDPQWVLRDQLLERFGIVRGGRQYECETKYVGVN